MRNNAWAAASRSLISAPASSEMYSATLSVDLSIIWIGPFRGENRCAHGNPQYQADHAERLKCRQMEPRLREHFAAHKHQYRGNAGIEITEIWQSPSQKEIECAQPQNFAGV